MKNSYMLVFSLIIFCGSNLFCVEYDPGIAQLDKLMREKNYDRIQDMYYHATVERRAVILDKISRSQDAEFSKSCAHVLKKIDSDELAADEAERKLDATLQGLESAARPAPLKVDDDPADRHPQITEVLIPQAEAQQKRALDVPDLDIQIALAASTRDLNGLQALKIEYKDPTSHAKIDRAIFQLTKGQDIRRDLHERNRRMVQQRQLSRTESIKAYISSHQAELGIGALAVVASYGLYKAMKKR